MNAHPQLVGGCRSALVHRQPGMDEEGLQPVGQTKLTVGHADQGAVAAVPVEEHQLARRCRRQAPAEVVEHCQQRPGAQPDRPRRPGVLVGLGVVQRGEQPDIVLVAATIHRCLGNGGGNHGVGGQGQVRSMLLDGAERLEQDAALGQSRGDVRGAQVGKTSARQGHPARLGAWRPPTTTRWSSAPGTTASCAPRTWPKAVCEPC